LTKGTKTMKKITLHNYEIYAIDYIDGALNAAQEKALLEFFDAHPELKSEFELVSGFKLDSSAESYSEKETLKKSVSDLTIDDNTIDEWCIAFLEDDLDEKGNKKFVNALNKNANYASLYQHYLKTKLVAEKMELPGMKPWKLPNFNQPPKMEDAHYWVIAELENDLTLNQLAKWKGFKTTNQAVQSLENDLKKTFLQPERIAYPHKRKLKHISKKRYLYPLTSMAAAAVLFYMFISIANLSDDTFKSYNQQVAAIEKATNEGETPTPSFFNATVKKQLMQVIDTYAQQQSVATRKTLANNKPVREALSTMGTISPRSIAEFNKQCGDLTIDSDSQKIMAPAVPEMQYAQNEVRQQIALNEDDKLTLFKAAQKGVEVINNKTGTNIELEKEKKQSSGRKKVTFATRYFSITKSTSR
jgi:hypothetical protein